MYKSRGILELHGQIKSCEGIGTDVLNCLTQLPVLVFKPLINFFFP